MEAFLQNIINNLQ